MNDVVELTLDQELDAVVEMNNSTGWALLMQEAEALYAAEGQRLDEADDLHKLGLTQGFRRALAWVSNYPELKRTVIEQAQEEDNE